MADPLQNDQAEDVDLLNRWKFTERVGSAVMKCEPPMVFGLHGEWGAGKTSALLQLQRHLVGECPQLGRDKLQRHAVDDGNKQPACGVYKEKAIVVWFEAWRYQSESNPVVPLLREMREQLSMRAKIGAEAAKIGEVTLRGVLFGLDSLTKAIGVSPKTVQEQGDAWEREHFAAQLPTDVIRSELTRLINQLIGNELLADGEKRRVVVLVDDLDRCDPDTAYRLLEGIKLFLNLDNCVFVLAINQRVIEEAIAKRPGAPQDDAKRWAREYLEKLCQDIWQLPLDRDVSRMLACWIVPTDTEKTDWWRARVAAIAKVVTEYRVLPFNARKVKAWCRVVARMLEAREPVWAETPPLDPSHPLFQQSAEALLVVGAWLYHFEPEIFHHLVAGQDDYWQFLINEFTPTPTGLDSKASDRGLSREGRHESFGKLRRTQGFTGSLLQNEFPNPVHGAWFRIDRLIADMAGISKDALTKGIIAPATFED